MPTAACQGTRTITYKRKKRDTQDEMEEIKAVHDVDNPHLKAIILLAIDGGMRRGEILKLRWTDFDYENSLIHILGTHTKTERARIAPLTQRVIDELNRIKEFTPGEKPFPFTDFKRSFTIAKRIAEIANSCVSVLSVNFLALMVSRAISAIWVCCASVAFKI